MKKNNSNILKQKDIFKIDKHTVTQLKKYPFSKCTLNKNKSCTQKEIAGSLSLIKNNLKLDKSSIIYGNEEGVPIVKSFYNFHSHPKEAYEKYNVKYAIPSSQDYIGYIHSVYKHNTRCHFIAAIEGVYIISMSKSFCNMHSVKQARPLHGVHSVKQARPLHGVHIINTLFETQNSTKHLINFIKKKYNENNLENDWLAYIKEVNSILYKCPDGKSIVKLFDVKFNLWPNLHSKNIKIYY